MRRTGSRPSGFSRMNKSSVIVSSGGGEFRFEFDPLHEVIFGNDNKSPALKAFIYRRLETRMPVAGKTHSFRGSFSVRLTPYNPLIDTESIVAAAEYAYRHGLKTVNCIGGILGTAPLEIRNDNTSAEGSTRLKVSDAMRKYRTCFDVRRQKRLKIFLNSMMGDPFFQSKSIDEIAEYLSSDEGTELVLSYGEDVKLSRQTKCPLCSTDNIYSVHPNIGWPRVGFLTCNSRYYYECGGCRYIFLNPSYKEHDCHKYYDDADSEISVDNKIDCSVEKLPYYLNNCDAAATLQERYVESPSLHFIDLGAGQCGFSRILRKRFKSARISAYDFKKPESYAEVQQSQISFIEGDFFKSLESCDDGSITAVTAFELVEHLTVGSFKKLIKLAHRKLRQDGMFILSTPDKTSRDLDLTDFWVAYAPQHLSVFNRELLKEQFEEGGFALRSMTWRSYAFNNDDIELSFYRNAYKGICDPVSSQMQFLIDHNDARLKNGGRCLSGDSQGSEVIMFFVKDLE
jgi:hypothetical protein